LYFVQLRILAHVASAPASTQHKEESAECSFMEVDYESDDDWFFPIHNSRTKGAFSARQARFLPCWTIRTPAAPAALVFWTRICLPEALMPMTATFAPLAIELPMFAEENLCDFDGDFLMFTM